MSVCLIFINMYLLINSLGFTNILVLLKFNQIFKFLFFTNLIPEVALIKFSILLMINCKPDWKLKFKLKQKWQRIKSCGYNNFYVSIMAVLSKNHTAWILRTTRKQGCQYMYLVNQIICHCLITWKHCFGLDSNRLPWHVFIDICLHHITTHGCITRCPCTGINYSVQVPP